MRGFQHFAPGNGFGEPLWPLVLGRIVPILVFALIVGLIVWAVLHYLRDHGVARGTGASFAPRPDSALETVRQRYARGEIDRDEFARLVTDLGGPAPAAGAAGAPPPPA